MLFGNKGFLLMSTGLIFMAILGCGDAGGSCEQVGRAPVTYSSMAECQAAQVGVLATSKFDFPELAAQCSSSTPAVAPKATPRHSPLRMASARSARG